MAGDRFASVNPARPAEVIAEFDVSSAAEVDAAVARAGAAQRGWAQVLPDPDEPFVHVYAEGKTEEVSVELETELGAQGRLTTDRRPYVECWSV